MLINMTDVLSCEGKVINRKAEIELVTFKSALGSFEITKKEPLELTISNLGDNKLLIEGNTVLSIMIPCDRCLSDVETTFELTIAKDVDLKESEENRIEDLNETEFIIGYNLDVDKLVYTEILVNWPMKILCNESCKGICRKCGTNLNHSTCDCDTEELDPRMAAIRNIFAGK